MHEHDVPSDIRVLQKSFHDVVYQLPRRNLGGLRALGAVALAMGGFITLFMAFWMYHPLRGAFGSHGAVQWVTLVFGLLGLPGLALGLALLGLGLAILLDLTRARYMQKPFTTQSLLDGVRRVLDGDEAPHLADTTKVPPR